MKKIDLITVKTIVFIVLFLRFSPFTNAQTTISIEKSIPIPDHPSYHDDREDEEHEHGNNSYAPLTLYIPVWGLPAQIDTTFGIEKVQLSIKHSRISDIKIELFSPDGTLVWISNRNGKNGEDYRNATFTQRGFDGPISSAEAPFSGEYQPDGNLASFNNGQDPNGNWILKVHDLGANTEGVFEKVSLAFSDNPARMRTSPCSFSNPQACVCSRVDGKMMPDLVISAMGTAANMWEIAYDSTKGYGMLMFEVRVMNLGEGPLELVGTNKWLCGPDTVADRNVRCREGDETNDSIYPRQIFQQNIYRIKNGQLDKITRTAGTMAYDGHPGHDHYHADYYARFTLLKPIENEPDTSKWEQVGAARKASFCLWDMQFCDEENKKCDAKGRFYDERTLPNYGFGTYRSCDDPRRQGISVGGIDWYGLHYDGQNLRLPSTIANGLYFLKLEIDPFNFYEEADETNNVLILPVVFRFQKGDTEGGKK
ncbi:MAG: proprotein convertase P-domain-containing protein [Saprospiraceae bacterium]|nr:proprotein convertase P-domain-containing protein [Saprospiraceae bacterium]